MDGDEGFDDERRMLDRYVRLHREYMAPSAGRLEIWARYARLAGWSRLVSESLDGAASQAAVNHLKPASELKVLAAQFARDYAGYRLLARRVANGDFPTSDP